VIRPAYRPAGSPPTLEEYRELMADRDRPLTDYPMGRRRTFYASHGDQSAEDPYTGVTLPEP